MASLGEWAANGGGASAADLLGSLVEVLVLGAGGLGCELLKDLVLSGFKKLHVIDMDTIDVSNLDRQFLFRVEDVGKSKAEVAAKRVMERVNGVNIVPHFCRIEDKEIEFYSQFQIIVLGLDSIEARSYINSVARGFLDAVKQTQDCYVASANYIEYAHLIEWDEIYPGKPFDADDAEHMHWIFSEMVTSGLMASGEPAATY